jgi:hypothetical protein
LGFDPGKDLSDDECEKLLNAVADRLMDTGFDKDYRTNEVGEICEDIISIITIAR